jgi:hypothetical protein
MDGLDDFVGVDSLEIDRRHAEIPVAELALNDIQRHTLAQQLDRMRVTQLLGRSVRSALLEPVDRSARERRSSRGPQPV